MSIRSDASSDDGTFAPAIVSQKTTVNMSSISGKPNTRLVTRRSSVASKSKRRCSPSRETARSAMRAASE